GFDQHSRHDRPTGPPPSGAPAGIRWRSTARAFAVTRSRSLAPEIPERAREIQDFGRSDQRLQRVELGQEGEGYRRDPARCAVDENHANLAARHLSAGVHAVHAIGEIKTVAA